MNKYSLIYADPPWAFNNKNTGGSLVSGASAKYDVMDPVAMAFMPISMLTADDAVLFMWWVGSQPQGALALMKAWGFRLVTMTGFVWVKETKHGKPDFGMGFWTRAGSECCLIAVKGKPKRADAGIRSVYIDEELIGLSVRAKKEEHSKKPGIFREMIVQLCGDVPRLEMFAREQTPGWDVFGNEVENSIVIYDDRNQQPPYSRLHGLDTQ